MARRLKVKMSQLMTKVSLGVALAGALAVTLPSASYAFGEHEHYYDSENEPGSTWSYYKGYFSNDSTGQATRPQQQQERTNSRAPRRNATTEPSQVPTKPSCMVGAYGGCQ